MNRRTDRLTDISDSRDRPYFVRAVQKVEDFLSQKKLSPKCRDPPTAMLDSNMHLLTDPYLIEKLALKTYKERLQNRPMKEDLIDLKESKEELCQLRLELAGQNKSNPWTMDQLEVVLRNFKNDKSRDTMDLLMNYSNLIQLAAT